MTIPIQRKNMKYSMIIIKMAETAEVSLSNFKKLIMNTNGIKLNEKEVC